MDVRTHAHFGDESQSFPCFEARKLAPKTLRTAAVTTIVDQEFESLGAKNLPTMQEETRRHIGA
jgi:hypothetical protein